MISGARFAPYLDDCAGDRDSALRLYHWNVAVSSALWGPIAIFEVALRNAIHKQMCARAGRDDWWADASLALLPRESDQVATARSKANDQAERRARSNSVQVTPPSPGHVVAASGLGLWVGLLSAGTPRDPRYSYETALWQPRLRHAFPNLGSGGRKELYDECNRIRLVRNRIAHHEPLAIPETVLVVGFIEKVLAYIDQGSSQLVATNSRVLDIIAKRTNWEQGTARVYFL